MIRYVILILLLCPSVVMAKCVSEYRTILGNLTMGDRPLVGAKVTSEFRDGLNNFNSNSITTDQNGNYLIKIKYNKYSGGGIFVGDKCKFSLVKLQLEIGVKEHVLFKDSITVSKESTTYNKAFNVMDAANRGTH